MFKKIVWIFLLLVLFIAIHFLNIYAINYYHEGVHESICLYNGGEIVNQFVSLIEGYTTCSINNEDIIKGFMLTDIIGYHLMAFVVVIEVLVFIILAFVVIRS